MLTKLLPLFLCAGLLSCQDQRDENLSKDLTANQKEVSPYEGDTLLKIIKAEDLYILNEIESFKAVDLNSMTNLEKKFISEADMEYELSLMQAKGSVSRTCLIDKKNQLKKVKINEVDKVFYKLEEHGINGSSLKPSFFSKILSLSETFQNDLITKLRERIQELESNSGLKNKLSTLSSLLETLQLDLGLGEEASNDVALLESALNTEQDIPKESLDQLDEDLAILWGRMSEENGDLKSQLRQLSIDIKKLSEVSSEDIDILRSQVSQLENSKIEEGSHFRVMRVQVKGEKDSVSIPLASGDFQVDFEPLDLDTKDLLTNLLGGCS